MILTYRKITTNDQTRNFQVACLTEPCPTTRLLKTFNRFGVYTEQETKASVLAHCHGTELLYLMNVDKPVILVINDLSFAVLSYGYYEIHVKNLPFGYHSMSVKPT